MRAAFYILLFFLSAHFACGQGVLTPYGIRHKPSSSSSSSSSFSPSSPSSPTPYEFVDFHPSSSASILTFVSNATVSSGSRSVTVHDCPSRVPLPSPDNPNYASLLARSLEVGDVVTVSIGPPPHSPSSSLFTITSLRRSLPSTTCSVDLHVAWNDPYRQTRQGPPFPASHIAALHKVSSFGSGYDFVAPTSTGASCGSLRSSSSCKSVARLSVDSFLPDRSSSLTLSFAAPSSSSSSSPHPVHTPKAPSLTVTSDSAILLHAPSSSVSTVSGDLQLAANGGGITLWSPPAPSASSEDTKPLTSTSVKLQVNVSSIAMLDGEGNARLMLRKNGTLALSSPDLTIAAAALSFRALTTSDPSSSSAPFLLKAPSGLQLEANFFDMHSNKQHISMSAPLLNASASEHLHLSSPKGAATLDGHLLTLSSSSGVLFLNDTRPETRDGTPRPPFHLSSMSALNISSSPELILHSKNLLRLTSGTRIALGDVATAEPGTFRAGGLLANATATYLLGDATSPLILRSPSIRVSIPFSALDSGNGGAVAGLKVEHEAAIGQRAILAPGPRAGPPFEGAAVVPTIELQSDDGSASLMFTTPDRMSAYLQFKTTQNRATGFLEFYHGGEGADKPNAKNKGTGAYLSATVGGSERLRVTSSGFVGVGAYFDHLNGGEPKAPLHVRKEEVTGRRADTVPSVAALFEGRQNSLQLVGLKSGSDVNNVIFEQLPSSGGSPDYWIMSQRGPHERRFGTNSFIIGHSANAHDVVSDKGLEKLEHFTTSLSLTENGFVGVGVDIPSAKLSVGGEVEASDFLVFSDSKFVSNKQPLAAGRGGDILNKLSVHVCEFDSSKEQSWRGLSSSKEYCLIGQEVETADRDLVKSDRMGSRQLKMRGLVSLLVAGLKDVTSAETATQTRVDQLATKAEEKNVADKKRSEALQELSSRVAAREEAEKVYQTKLEKRLMDKDDEVAQLSAEVAKLNLQAQQDAKLRDVMKSTIDDLAELLASTNKQLAAMGDGVRNLSAKVEALSNVEAAAGGSLSSDQNFFLGEIKSFEDAFVDDQEGPVTDKQLDTLRAKWRVEALVNLQRRRDDIKFFKEKAPK